MSWDPEMEYYVLDMIWGSEFIRSYILSRSLLCLGCLFKGPSRTLNQFPGLETVFLTSAPGGFSQVKLRNACVRPTGGQWDQRVALWKSGISPSPPSAAPRGHRALVQSFA